MDFDFVLHRDRQANEWRIADLEQAQLYWVTPDMTRVALDAATDIPPWTPSEVMPAPTGLIIWAESLPPTLFQSDTFGTRAEKRYAPTDALLWDTVKLDRSLELANGEVIPPQPNRVNFTFYTRTGTAIRSGLVSHRREAPLVEAHHLSVEADSPLTRQLHWSRDALMAAVGATWTLMQMPTVAAPRQVSGAGGSGRAWTAQQRQVSIIDLRRIEQRDSTPTDSAGRTYRHRWYVRGHWREQPHGPGRTLRRPTWIPGYIKGPPGAPIQALERVHVWRR